MLPLYFYHHFRLDYPPNIIKIHRRRAKESSLHLVCKHQRTIMLTTIFCIHLLQLTIYFLLCFFSVFCYCYQISLSVSTNIQFIHDYYQQLYQLFISIIIFLICFVLFGCSILFLFFSRFSRGIPVNSCCYY